jgi:FAD/FMN-containing dehydrogenase
VGVGGYLLQGGISFLSAQEGLAADSIVGWETVMANGSIVNVDAASRPDLAQAMRGSGSQFGIVTKYTIKPHHIGQVYGGFCLYDESQDDKIHAALHEFVASGAHDPKAAIIVSQLVAVGGSKSNIMYTFYDGPTPPTNGPFANFLKIPGIGCAPKSRSYADLVCTNICLLLDIIH